MKRLIFLHLMLVCCLISWGQTREIQPFEVELRAGFTLPLGSFHNSDLRIGPQIGVEGRYNFNESHFDAGFMIDVSTAVHGLHGQDSRFTGDQSNRTINLFVVGDYNFSNGSKFNPFFGLGAGISLYDTVTDKIYPASGTGFGVMPRIGIEMFQRLRITATTLIVKKGYNNFGLSIGYTFGGRVKN